MPLDIYARESLDRMATMPGVEVPDPSIWDGFVRGSAMYTMRGFATTARAIDMVGAVGPIAQDAYTGGTEAQDRYFKEHDEVFGSAVDYWTPKPGEVGEAGMIVGTLASMLPTVLTSPMLAVLSAQMGAGEELVKKGVPAGKAQIMGGIEGAAMGLGIWMPILGQNLWQRALLGGAGYNMAQGLAVRGAGQMILEDTPAAKDYQTLDLSAITLDALLGLAFGSFAHISPAQRAQGAAAWGKIRDWTQGWRAEDIDALAALRQAEHLNVDSMAGRPVGPEDIIAHVERTKAAIEQLARNEPVELSDRPVPRVEPDPARAEEQETNLKFLQEEAERIRVAEGLPSPDAFSRAQQPAEIQQDAEVRMVMREELQTLAAEKPPVKDALQGFLDATGKRWAMEERGQEILDTMEVNGIAPQIAARTFWSDTYFKLPSAVQERFVRMLNKNTGMEPGDVLWRKADTGETKIAENWQEIADALDLGDSAANLQGTERGFVALMQEANSRVFGESAAQPAGANALEQSREPGYGAPRETEATTQAKSAIGEAPRTAGKPEDLSATVGGGRPAEGWAGATRISRAGSPLPLYRGAARDLSTGSFATERLGGTSGNPSSGLGVWFTPTRTEAATYGIPQEVYLDLRNPKIIKIEDLPGFESTAEATAYREKLRAQGHDGIVVTAKHLGGKTHVVAFDPEQVIPSIVKGTGEAAPDLPAREKAAMADAEVQSRRPAEPEPATAEKPTEPTGGAKATADPVASAASRVAEQYPDLLIPVGQNADGTPIHRTVRQILDDAQAAVERANDDARLFDAAADCLIGGGT